jgi:hypothetical protein
VFFSVAREGILPHQDYGRSTFGQLDDVWPAPPLITFVRVGAPQTTLGQVQNKEGNAAPFGLGHSCADVAGSLNQQPLHLAKLRPSSPTHHDHRNGTTDRKNGVPTQHFILRVKPHIRQRISARRAQTVERGNLCIAQRHLDIDTQGPDTVPNSTETGKPDADRRRRQDHPIDRDCTIFLAPEVTCMRHYSTHDFATCSPIGCNHG